MIPHDQIEVGLYVAKARSEVKMISVISTKQGLKYWDFDGFLDRISKAEFLAGPFTPELILEMQDDADKWQTAVSEIDGIEESVRICQGE